jgi:hypothetical protein
MTTLSDDIEELKSSSQASPPDGLPEPEEEEDELAPIPAPVSLPYPHYSLAPVLDRCDNVVLPLGPFTPNACPVYALSTTEDKQYDDEPLVPFFVEIGDARPVGFLRPVVVDALKTDNAKVKKSRMQECWKVLENDQGRVWAVAFEDWLNEEGVTARQEHLDRLIRGWKEGGHFSSLLGGP